jgi:anaerobic C4-dicarboxylate transporter
MPQLISVGQIIDHSWEQYRSRFSQFVSVSAWLFFPAVLAVVSLALYPSATTLASQQDLNMIETIGVIIWMLNTFLLVPVLGLWIFITLIRLSQELHTKDVANLHTFSAQSWKVFWPTVM